MATGKGDGRGIRVLSLMGSGASSEGSFDDLCIQYINVYVTWRMFLCDYSESVL